ncbi:MAG: hypothetical protein GY754_31075 [bacterium]|nr:hypothetical protein [bacterium]
MALDKYSKNVHKNRFSIILLVILFFSLGFVGYHSLSAAIAPSVVERKFRSMGDAPSGIFLRGYSEMKNMVLTLKNCYKESDFKLVDHDFSNMSHTYIRKDMVQKPFGALRFGFLYDVGIAAKYIVFSTYYREDPKDEKARPEIYPSDMQLPKLHFHTPIAKMRKKVTMNGNLSVWMKRRSRPDQLLMTYDKNFRMSDVQGLLNQMVEEQRQSKIASRKKAIWKEWNEVQTYSLPCEAYAGVFYTYDIETRKSAPKKDKKVLFDFIEENISPLWRQKIDSTGAGVGVFKYTWPKKRGAKTVVELKKGANANVSKLDFIVSIKD